MEVDRFLHYAAPYQFSPLIAISFALTLGLYLRGYVRAPAAQGIGPRVAFLTGLGLCYAAMHTRFDYYAQYMFFMHRLQHLVLHHLGPFLIALGAPWALIARGVPEAVRRPLPAPLGRVVAGVYGVLQHPVVAPLLFVGLILFWLQPGVHFDAMLSLPMYHLMNWSMFIDGLLFWWLILDPRDPERAGTLPFGRRILLLIAVVPPQILVGAYIALSRQELYDVYSVCGRAWPLAPETDQELGGLITWIPSAMMSVIGVLVLLWRIKVRDRSDELLLAPQPTEQPT